MRLLLPASADLSICGKSKKLFEFTPPAKKVVFLSLAAKSKQLLDHSFKICFVLDKESILFTSVSQIQTTSMKREKSAIDFLLSNSILPSLLEMRCGARKQYFG